ncbi:MAG: M48 family metallopeptidase [Deltaproteobacteria bacterium]|jgi:predicted Zn-dependent protease|nr:M48 family metallopeptidase [Deltaproteobacteria bacterium]
MPRQITQKFFQLLLCCSLLFVLTACGTVVGTNRRQLSLVGDDTINQQALQEYNQFMSQATLSTNSRDTAMVKKVGQKIAKAAQMLMDDYGRGSEIANYSWEFNLVQSDEANAFCMPGGKIVVYTGLLPITKNEAGLATVMGHEVAHALARHGAERASDAMAVELGGTILGTVLGASSVSGGNAALIMSAYGIGSQVGVLLPFSRTHEAEADRLGLSLMALAGYDPEEALSFWERMSAVSQASGKSTPYFLSTHPSDAARIANIKSYIPEARARAVEHHITMAP